MGLFLSSNKFIHDRKSQTILNIVGDVGGFNDAILLLFGPLILLYSSKNFDLAVPEGSPVLLKSQVIPSGKSKQLKQRMKQFVDARTSRMIQRL